MGAADNKNATKSETEVETNESDECYIVYKDPETGDMKRVLRDTYHKVAAKNGW